jgi:hypothetical protein
VTFAVVIGRLADRYSLELLGPVLVAATLVLAVVLWLLVSTASRSGAGSGLAD